MGQPAAQSTARQGRVRGPAGPGGPEMGPLLGNVCRFPPGRAAQAAGGGCPEVTSRAPCDSGGQQAGIPGTTCTQRH